MNEKFYTLPEEKQQSILNSAMEVFALNEYKRASTDLIAAKAGVSKGLLFYYFHNKKELYLYLYNYVVDIVKAQVVDRRFKEIIDFYELLRYSATEKVKLLEKNPYILEFAIKTFYSEKEDVSEDLQKMTITQTKAMYKEYFEHLDLYKFKDEADPLYIYKMLVWMADGYMHDLKMCGRVIELEDMMAQFEIWMSMLKKLTYKEEYLNENHRN
ncbi:TetR/AcrR family transcriptional regulator [Hespellia stercorisuis]|uniref:Transcriptional regulator, TetR family n=1 Tax=Hespellia stercorisuis DSM 15480 TaxID=1121950 RepID=A0A1M6TZG9_9FIRM|nr:TetR/AcrR family transcriptional regulator [Hespellia stercorisuis]SHK62432.1 transcriptional regulator, TetR family [Hespellia stercorisuis DSM 15480]